jgi:hypothetical protein
MPVKKTAPKKSKVTTKKTPKKKPATKKTVKSRKGDTYKCSVCGYRLIVDEVCGCAEEHVFICCEKTMKKK